MVGSNWFASHCDTMHLPTYEFKTDDMFYDSDHLTIGLLYTSI